MIQRARRRLLAVTAATAALMLALAAPALSGCGWGRATRATTRASPAHPASVRPAREGLRSRLQRTALARREAPEPERHGCPGPGSPPPCGACRTSPRLRPRASAPAEMPRCSAPTSASSPQSSARTTPRQEAPRERAPARRGRDWHAGVRRRPDRDLHRFLERALLEALGSSSRSSSRWRGRCCCSSKPSASLLHPAPVRP